MPAPVLRSICEEDEVGALIDSKIKQYPRIDELWEGWKWRLSRDPFTDAVPVRGSNPPAFLIKSPDLTAYGLPSGMTILYTFNNECVYVVGLRIP